MLNSILQRLRRIRLPPVAPAAVFTLLASLGLTAVLYVSMRSLESERDRAAFERDAGVWFAAIDRGFIDATEVVRGINLLFTAVGAVDRAQFDAYAVPLGARVPEVQSLVFRRFVSGAGRAAFEDDQRRIRPGFQITARGPAGLARAPQRPVYLVVEYSVPARAAAGADGEDAWSQPAQRALAERAIDSGRPAASELIALPGQQGSPGLVVVMPVYRKGVPLPDVAARRGAVVGDTALVIDLAGLVRHDLARAGLLDQPGIVLTLRGASAGAGGAGVAYQFGVSAPAVPAWRHWLDGERLSAARTMQADERQWEMAVAGRAGALPGHLGSGGVLILGTLLSLALAGLVQLRVQRTRRIEWLVKERTAALQRAIDSLRLYQRTIDASQNGIILADARQPGYPIEYVNPAYERMRGRSAAELVGRSLVELIACEPDQPAVEEVRKAIREGRAAHTLLRDHDREGRARYSDVYVAPVVNPPGVVEHVVVILCDVTSAKHYEEELEHRARYDLLTGLPNRALLVDRLGQALCFAAAGRDPVWVAAMDLDQFKFVNDSLGHQAGDRLLQTVAARIAAALQRTDTVARTGGDEFVLVLPGRRDVSQVAATLQGVLDQVAGPLQLGEQLLVITCSAGVAGYPGDGDDAETLVKHAEIAMYRAKESGRNTIQFYTPALTARARERLELEGALRHAVARGEFELYYQPQVDLATGCVIGLEALIRWHHQQLGLVHPERFIALAEETGLIVQIGAWALRTACYQSRAWQSAGLAPPRIAVNLSARQFAEPDLREVIAGVLAESGLAAACLEIEVTESLMMTNAEAAIGTMHEIKAMGIGLSIDDFGTGYSSLSYLKRFPADVLKIDKSFVHDLAGSPDNGAMVTAIIALARGLHMRVIAEGVETQAQLDYLRAEGCDYVQGYLYSRAVPVAEIERILREGRCFTQAAA